MDHSDITVSKKPLKNLGYILFHLNYFLWMMIVMLHHLPVIPKVSDSFALNMEYTSVFVGISLFIFGFFIRVNKEATIENLFVVVLIVSLLYNLLRSGGGVVGPLQAVTFLASAINIPSSKLRKFLKYDIILRTGILIFVVLTGYGNGGYYGVGYAGFVNINPFGMWIMVIVVECFLLLKSRFFYMWLLFATSVTYLLYTVGSSRTAVLSLLVSAILSLLFFKHNIKKKLSYLWIIIPSIIVIFYQNINYFSSNFIYKLNNLFSDRITMAQTILSQYKIELWGQRIVLVSRSLASMSFGRLQYLVLDNSYLTMLLMIGLISTILAITLLIRGSFQLFYKFKSLAILPIVFFSLLGVSENNMIMIEYNFLFIVMGALLLNKHTEYEKNKSSLV